MPERHSTSSSTSRPHLDRWPYPSEDDPPEGTGSCLVAAADRRAGSPTFTEEPDKTLEAGCNTHITATPAKKATVLEVLQTRGGHLV